MYVLIYLVISNNGYVAEERAHLYSDWRDAQREMEIGFEDALGYGGVTYKSQHSVTCTIRYANGETRDWAILNV